MLLLFYFCQILVFLIHTFPDCDLIYPHLNEYICTPLRFPFLKLISLRNTRGGEWERELWGLGGDEAGDTEGDEEGDQQGQAGNYRR